MRLDNLTDCVKRKYGRHGCSRSTGNTKEYRSWTHAVGRCFNEGDSKFSDYGGRGITMCQKWRVNFNEFLKDMGLCPTGLTLDRIDVNGDYEPGNCRWATAKQQARNRRNNRILTIDGVDKCMSEWGEVSGVKPRTIHRRIVDLGWDYKRAVFTATV